MAFSLKLLARTALRKIGFEPVHTAAALQDVRARDATEIEELYRRFVFPDLPKRDYRARCLSGLIGTTISEGVYVLRALHEGLRVPGDICEFGVAQGATSRLLANEILSLGERRLWLFDSFEGLPAPTSEDKLIDDIFNLGSMERYRGTMASREDEVIAKLKGIGFPFDRVRIKKGWVHETIRQTEVPTQVAFAYVDFDFYQPIKDALEFLDPRMPAGGMIVVDDYDFFSDGAKLAVQEFLAATGQRFTFELPLPFAGHFCTLKKVPRPASVAA